MIFSAGYYPHMATSAWQLPGAEVILDKEHLTKYRELANRGVFLTAHSPMTVSIGSTKKGVRFLSTNQICEHLQLLHEIQPQQPARIVVHAANFSGRTPGEVYEVQRKTLWSLWYKMKDAHLLDSSLVCIENLGKINQVGDVEDIMRLCKLTDNFIPCIDFGHLYGRSLGKQLNSKEEFLTVFNQLYSALPRWKVDNMHIHYSKLVYTDKGEKKHTNFHEKAAGPKPAFFIRALSNLPSSFSPVIVCESSDPHRDGLALKRNFECHRHSTL